MQPQFSLETVMMMLSQLFSASMYDNQTHHHCERLETNEFQQIDALLQANEVISNRLAAVNRNLELLIVQFNLAPYFAPPSNTDRHCRSATGGITQVLINRKRIQLHCESNKFGANWLVIGSGQSGSSVAQILRNPTQSFGNLADDSQDYFIGLAQLRELFRDEADSYEALCVWYDPELELEQYVWWPLFRRDALEMKANNKFKLRTPKFSSLSVENTEPWHIRSWKIYLRTKPA